MQQIVVDSARRLLNHDIKRLAKHAGTNHNTRVEVTQPGLPRNEPQRDVSVHAESTRTEPARTIASNMLSGCVAC